jgi:hypothetical protein
VSLHHLIARRRSVHGYSCTGPTVASVYLALGLFSREIAVCRKSFTVGMDPATTLRHALEAVARTADERVLEVLSTCVTGGPLSGASHQIVAELALTVLDLTDIDELLDLDPPTDDSEDDQADSDEETDEHSRVVVVLARAHSCSPSEVMAWPYDAFLETIRVVETERAEKIEGSDISGDFPAAMPGLAHVDARNF